MGGRLVLNLQALYTNYVQYFLYIYIYTYVLEYITIGPFYTWIFYIAYLEKGK
jgi:hypothetical protein